MLQGLIPDFILLQSRKGITSGSFPAWVLTCDIQGFTKITNAFLKEGSGGAERLAQLINTVFGHLLDTVHAHQGFVSYFAGDSITAYFNYEPSVIQSLVCHMEDTFRKIHQELSQNHGVEVQLRGGATAGPVQWYLGGSVLRYWYLKGEVILQAAQIQSKAEPGSILIGNRNVSLLKDTESLHLQAKDKLTHSIEELKLFLPTVLLESEHIGEFRTVASLFINIHMDTREDELRLFIQVIEQLVIQHGGYFKEIDIGDKGIVICSHFGAPVSHTHNLQNAWECIVQILHWTRHHPREIQWRGGIAMGRAFCGMVGNHVRRQYIIAGNYVNLAARLMTQAHWGEIWCDAGSKEEDYFEYRSSGKIQYKGFEHEIATCIFQGKKSFKKRDYGTLLFREKETQFILQQFRQATRRPHPQWIAVTGPSGIGKSHLIAHVKQKVKVQNPEFKFIHCEPGRAKRAFELWIQTFQSIFQKWSIEDCIQVLKKQQLNGIFTERQVTLRIQALHSMQELVHAEKEVAHWERDVQLFIQQIQLAFQTIQWIAPICLVIDKPELFDELSLDVFIQWPDQKLPNALVVLGTFLHATDAKSMQYPGFRNTQVHLTLFDEEQSTRYLEALLNAPITPEVRPWIMQITEGNPYYIREVVRYFTTQHDWRAKQGKYDIPDHGASVHDDMDGILIAGLDAMQPATRELLKLAALSEFGFLLPVCNYILKFTSEKLQNSIREGLEDNILEEKEGGLFYFSQRLLKDAIARMQFETQRVVLHKQLAHAYEQLYTDQPEYADETAFHFTQCNENVKAAEYYQIAARHANTKFQFRQGLIYYNKLLNCIPELDQTWRVQVLLEAGEVNIQLSMWGDALRLFEKALQNKNFLEPTIEGKLYMLSGKVHMMLGNYPEAYQALDKGGAIFHQIQFLGGIFQTRGILGNLAFRTGDYQKAKELLESYLHLAESLPGYQVDAQQVATLGLIFMNTGRYDLGERILLHQLASSKQQNDLRNQALLEVYLSVLYFEWGKFPISQKHAYTGFEISEQIGNQHLQCIAMGFVGSVYLVHREYEEAKKWISEDYAKSSQIGDKQGIAIASELLGQYHMYTGAMDQARDMIRISIKLCRTLKYQKGLAKALCTLSYGESMEGKLAIASKYATEAIQIAQSTGNKRQEACAMLFQYWADTFRNFPKKPSTELHIEEIFIPQEFKYRWDALKILQECRINNSYHPLEKWLDAQHDSWIQHDIQSILKYLPAQIKKS